MSHPSVPPPSSISVPRHLPIQQPDPRYEQARVAALREVAEETLQTIENAKAKQQMDDVDKHDRYERQIGRAQENLRLYNQSLLQNPLFGNVFATSGYRVDEVPVEGFSHGCTLDWGMIEVDPPRVGRNEVCRACLPAPSLKAAHCKPRLN
jgi:hypothetical protein